MRFILQFLEVWGAWIALTAGTISVALWVLSIDGDSLDESVGSSMLWAIYWPLIWLYRWLTGKNRASVPDKGSRLVSSKAGQQVAVEVRDAKPVETIREAKECLASTITWEAEHSGAPLTEVERKMLYFSETGWTLPDMKQVSAEFDRNYDQDKYEQKIALLIDRIQAGFTAENIQERTKWRQALDKLSEGDHYLLVLVNAAKPARKGPKHNVKMLVAALVFLAIAVVDVWFLHWLREH